MTQPDTIHDTIAELEPYLVHNPKGFLPIHLATLHRAAGSTDKAHALIKGKVTTFSSQVTDKDVDKVYDGLLNFRGIFMALGDDRNALAVLLARREYDEKTGLAILVNNANILVAPTKKRGTKALAFNPVCHGACLKEFTQWDGMALCRICEARVFCAPCFQLLKSTQRAGRPLFSCDENHGHLVVPVLTEEQRFKRGQMLVDGEIMDIVDWKKELKKEWAKVQVEAAD